MIYGLLADIHENVEFLAAALEQFARRGVERVIVLGDVFETGKRLEETTRLLASVQAEGVWGNHDYGLSFEPRDDVLARFSAGCMAFMTALRPTLEFEDCLVTHVEPWRAAEDICDLWSFERVDSNHLSFSERPHRLMLHGHHHRWKASTPDGPVAWDCFRPLNLDPSLRYLIQVGAVCDGRCGVLDTGSNRLTPIDLRDPDDTP
jgi:hypothetical protein